ncbi:MULTISPECIES: FAD binding domain-containing protein [Halorussus]|uniref:FAD binding domain-containing protein n=1 Tax=Halorussus TaxID=1070314 RepID=UPI00209E1063|nr:FAD binding domain-containing protein [Halorussus vallis]USZ78327.1 FAD binding domain-containing protein [Halorussus vallis]USZ78350.1 FAD binding domain-containing protein [Halorussus vallis]
MKPAPFEYHRPTSVSEVASLLTEHHDAELMAGNQSLGIVMANRLATPDHIIDLNRVEDLDYVNVGEDEIEIGAMTTHRTLERSAELAERVRMLPEAAEQIAGPSVRNRGTLGGSIGEADPAGNYPAALLALDATLTLRSADDSRTVPVDDYFIAYMFTDLREDEIIESAAIPTEPFPPERTGMAFLELKPAAQTWPTVSAGTAVRVDDPDADDPVIEEARVALANAADVPLRVPDAEEALEGEPLTEETLDAAAAAATEAADPEAEMHADEEFKVEVAGEYAKRSLETSYRRATDT